MKLTDTVLRWLAKKIKMPESALQMVRAANAMSGMDKKSLPTELIPLNAIQLSRGLLNYTVLQSLSDWVLPFWAEQQYRPEALSFVPRSHLGLSMNITHRNWTAIGHPGCNVEAIVDPRGLLTPFPNGWSVDTWLAVENEIFFPSRASAPEYGASARRHAEHVQQKLTDDLPIVETAFTFREIELLLTSWVLDGVVHHHARAKNISSAMRRCSIIFAIRPFNPEGVSLLSDIECDKSTNTLFVNKKEKVRAILPPSSVLFSNFKSGDCAALVMTSAPCNGTEHADGKQSIHCPSSLANAALVYDAAINPGGEYEAEITCPVAENESSNRFSAVPKNKPGALTPSLSSPARERREFPSPAKERIGWNRYDNDNADKISLTGHKEKIAAYWKNLFDGSTEIKTPSERLNALLRSSLTSLLMLVDDTTITPGPATYHQFWFRDAVYMIWALDKFGFSRFTSPIIRSFPGYQHGNGYFRSQQGEWDSNGQALWITWQHALFSHDTTILRELYSNLKKGTEWIAAHRMTGSEHMGKSYYGLMPRGLSAEHLGVADHYFWDSFWSLAGVKAFLAASRMFNDAAANNVEKLLNEFSTDIENSIAYALHKWNSAPKAASESTAAIPPSPTRRFDYGSIGNVAALYPLQLFPPDDEHIKATLRELEGKYFVDGMFFQPFIHSGKNAYLTLQIAHAYLYAGEREKFWNILERTAAHATPTLNFPEAIHPVTGGGSMGDGHHGWASAEIALALRDAFVYESDTALHLLAGIPAEWFVENQAEGMAEGKSFSIKNAPCHSGTLSLDVHCEKRTVHLEANFSPRNNSEALHWNIHLPFRITSVTSDTMMHLEQSSAVITMKPRKDFQGGTFRTEIKVEG
ncbi:MAG: hypothetical protein KGJ59_09025 [Bacteroidota bacterium]|nr:hypothetical protein [Bacteroidota bacterium]